MAEPREEMIETPDAPDDASEPSVRDALEQAVEQHSDENLESQAADIPEPQPGQPLRDESGRFAKKPDEAASPGVNGATPPVTPQPGRVSAPGATSSVPGAAPASEDLRAPQSWKPAVRELWNGLPAEVKQEVLRREREGAIMLQETSEARKVAETLADIVAPYHAFIAAEQSNPFQAIQNLFQTAAAIRTSPPAQKAQIVANIIKNYGVDPMLLDAALAGQGLPPQAMQPQLDPRVDEIMARLQFAEQQRAQATQQRASQTVEEFQKDHEYFEDLRYDMADILEIAAKQGKTMTMDEAYQRAVAMNPEIHKIVQQKQAASQARNAQASTARARAAASSIKNTPATPIRGKESSEGSVRGAIEDAIETLSGR